MSIKGCGVFLLFLFSSLLNNLFTSSAIKPAIGLKPAPNPQQKISNASKPLADWTFIIYIQANNDLSQFAIRNLKEMARVGSNSKLNILAQVDKPKQKGIWRYIINKEKIELSEHISESGDCVKDMVGGAKWAFKKFPSKFTGAIWWNHGSGILDPVSWAAGATRFANNIVKEPINTNHKGIFFNYISKTYMNNQQQLQALKEIKEKVLGGRKIDILGMDACLMAMVEVAYQVKNYARFFVASEEVASALGMQYRDFLQHAVNGLSPSDLSRYMVEGFANFYGNKIQWYTQSAIDLDKINLLKAGIDQILFDIENCKTKFGFSSVKNIVKSARKASLEFNIPCYIDLHSFLTELDKRVSSGAFRLAAIKSSPMDDMEQLTSPDLFREDKIDDKKAISNFEERDDLQYVVKSQGEFEELEVKRLKTSLLNTIKLLEGMVVANVSGDGVSRAKGLSIYFPAEYGIDASYIKTEFAKESSWIKFLIEML
ncbi:hypothetical protein KAW80_02015 [Candidatus Babeliales bacterium]|nr:hypothetical protein [Candidatus Babeliales bacterium]